MTGLIETNDKWWVLMGSEDKGDYLYHIHNFDHFPSAVEMDKAIEAFNDVSCKSFFLFEELARGTQSICLNFAKAERAVVTKRAASKRAK